MSNVYNKWLILIAVILLGIAPSMVMKACHDDYVDSAEADLNKARNSADRWQQIAAGYQYDAEILKSKIEELKKRKVAIRDTVYAFRGWRRDTIRVIETDSLCPELAAENSILWESYIQDSIMIDHQGRVIRLQDSVTESLRFSIADWRRVDSLNQVKFIRLKKANRRMAIKTAISAGLMGFFFGRI